MKKKTFIILVAVLGIALAGAGAGYRYLSKEYTPDEPAASQQSAQQTAADFTVLNKEGKGVSLSDHFGKPIVVNFWATWCGPCKSELPAFESAYQQYGGEIEFMMVNLTDNVRETQEIASTFVAENSYTFPLYYDTLSSAANAYNMYAVPMTLFIDSSGNLVQSYVGAMSEEVLNGYIDALKGGDSR